MSYFLTVLKFFLSILMFPIVYASSVNFYKHIELYKAGFHVYFFLGAISFLLVFLFLYQFWAVFESEQKAVGSIFKFAAPLDQFLIYLVPFYTVMILLILYIFRVLGKVDDLDQYFIFFAGFFQAMHLLAAAQELQEKEKTPIKPNYMFTISIAFIFNIVLIILLFDLVLKEWTFPKFLNAVYLDAQVIYEQIYDKLSQIVK